jgi:hypothetical protein
MALLFCDSFDHYNTSQIFSKWDTADAPSNIAISGSGRNGGSGITAIGGATVYKNFPAALSTVIVGFAIKFGNVSDSLQFLYFYDSTTTQLYVRFNADGSLSVFNGSATLLGTTAPSVLPTPTSVFNYVEVKVLHHASAGTVDIHVNGASVLALTGKATAPSGTAQSTKVSISRVLPSANNSWVVDDFYICDTSGGTANTFLGDVRVECVFPDGAGTTANLTPSAGSNYQNVDDNPGNDDTDYNSSSTVTDKDTFNYAALASTLGSVVAVAVNTRDRKDDAGTRTHSHLSRLSGTEDVGTAFSPTTSYSIHQTIFHSKPGGGAWTITDVNNAEFGYKLVS